ncbi:hypothetical protein BVRB_007060 [Beta vulgaris subsp. vulgaris]|uniref:Uncharacterized protein n=1 Tax=Beta vulgaris subsp. vulgaris TaxID=3555 RepID=A0A0J8DXI4_BETVV|nr:uncharacterized protein LOC130589661 [Beta vulgaris subsp. vulgaris]KMS95560.1 hypothetical protein BVRB_007060 [Beta vulgaris subsp. vulgaris]
MSEQHHHNTHKRPSQHHHNTLSKIPKQPPPPLSPSHHHFLSPETSANYDDDDVAAEQLISTLLASPPNKTTSFQVKFVSYPYLPLPPFECSSSYVTINGNEETCGSSFSDTHCSLMASVDTCGTQTHISRDSFAFLKVPNDAVFLGQTQQDDHLLRDWDWTDLLGEDEFRREN